MTFNVASRTPITARADVVIRQAAAKALGWQRWERESSDPGSAPGTTSFNDFAALFGNAASSISASNVTLAADLYVISGDAAYFIDLSAPVESMSLIKPSILQNSWSPVLYLPQVVGAPQLLPFPVGIISVPHHGSSEYHLSEADDAFQIYLESESVYVPEFSAAALPAPTPLSDEKSLREVILRFFPSAGIAAGMYVDPEENWQRTTLTVATGIVDFDERFAQEQAFYSEVDHNVALMDALRKVSIIFE